MHFRAITLVFLSHIRETKDQSSTSKFTTCIEQKSSPETDAMNSTEVQNPRRKLYHKCLRLPYVFGSVLACAKSAHVFQKLSYSLCGLCLSLKFLTNKSSSDSRPKAFLRFTAFSGSPTAVHRAFLFFDAKAWPVTN